ncbi:MAG: helix-turn-helix domain-containing protein [Eggerthellaceae bacterium]|nr:helix-turn-helix domain-containing protein [Eggerthellaceae bacterium]
MQYTYEFEMWRGERQWCIAPFDFDGATQGEDVGDACESAADWLRETILDRIMAGRPLPTPGFDNQPRHDGVRVIVSVDVSLDQVGRISAAEAARELGLSRPRITAMVNSGKLDGWREGRNLWVTRASVEARKADTPKAGRPKKVSVDAALECH